MTEVRAIFDAKSLLAGVGALPGPLGDEKIGAYTQRRQCNDAIINAIIIIIDTNNTIYIISILNFDNKGVN